MIYIYISSSSCRTISMCIPDPLLPLLPITHCFRQVLRATSRFGTELLYVGSSWLSYLCTSMWRGSFIYIYIYIYFKMSRSMKRFVFFGIYWFCSYIHVCFQFDAFIRKHIWHKALLMEYSMRLDLSSVCSLNDFQLVVGLYRGHHLFFLECVYLVCFTPHWWLICFCSIGSSCSRAHQLQLLSITISFSVLSYSLGS